LFPPFRGFLSHPYPVTGVRNRAGLAVLFAAGFVWGLVRTRPFRIAVEGASMAPTLEPGDFLVATRSGRGGRGSLVVVEHPGLPGYEIVKRVTGVAGDRVEGQVLTEGDRWVVGDNPDGSTDSRHFGPLPATALRGVVRLRYWPPSRFSVFD
jgi:nickel-type superoxide dismutase maturation protease